MTVVAPPEVEFMTDAVAHWAALQPDAEALTYGEVRWTWAQWDDRIRRVAGGLAARGLGRGSQVAFLDKNHPACLEVSLGAGLLGAAAWGAAPPLGFLFCCADASVATIRRTSNTDHFGTTFFPRLFDFIAAPVRYETISS